MTYYVSIGAARIQSWLIRTPELTHLRGGSNAIHIHTDPSAVQDVLKAQVPEASVEEDFSVVDGVVVATAPDQPSAQRAATALARRLSALLPGLEWEAWWCESDSYLRAFMKAVDPRQSGVGRLRVIPPLIDNGAFAPCDHCRREPATHRDPADQIHDGKQTRSGPDCRARRAAKVRSWRQIPGAAPRDFARLATAGGMQDPPPEGNGSKGQGGARALGKKDSQSHLATIAADGNGIGALFQEIARNGALLPTLQRTAYAKLNEFTVQAVVTAARAASDPALLTDASGRVKVVIPHFVGGDDVLISVPAARGWRFAQALATDFRRLAPDLEAALESDLASTPNMSPAEAARIAAVRRAIRGIALGVGIVFAHSSHPFADTHALAHTALAAAKAAGNGGEARIGWLDLTAGPDLLPHGRRSRVIPTITVAEVADTIALTRDDDRFTDVFKLTPSARARLATLMRGRTPDTALGAEIDVWAKRVPWQRTTEVAELGAALSRARWWPTAVQEEEER